MSQVTFHKDDDPALELATKKARATFRYFWRELSWENRRIVPGLGLAAFKVALSDDADNADSSAEVMWVNEVNFDGYHVSGLLLNQPNWLQSINQGDPVKISPKAIKDWLYTIDHVAYGGFTVHAIRKEMSNSERGQHDNAWGLHFGDPDQIHVVPPDWFPEEKPQKKGLFGFKKAADLEPEPVSEATLQSTEHPMAEGMADSLQEFISNSPEEVSQLGEDGLNMLHHMALTGSVAGLQTLLKFGADVNSRSKRNHTALDFAKSLGWKKAYALLAKNGGKHAKRKAR